MPSSRRAAARIVVDARRGRAFAATLISAAPADPLAVDAVGGPRERLEPLRRDRPAAADARRRTCPSSSRASAASTWRELLLVAVAQREVALLLEDLARGGRLRAVRHRAGRDDALGEPGAQPVALGLERRSRIGGGAASVVIGGSYDRRVRPVEPSRDILAGARTEEPGTMAIEIDPVCGMEVDTDTTDLKLEHDGTTYWFCGKGCLLEFQDDPENYLDADYEPSM